MKTILLIIFFPAISYAQIITSATKANFGVDADLRANYFNSLVTAAGDDWYLNSSGAGQNIIDTTGAAAIVARYTSNVSSRTQTFSRLMKQNPFSVLSNRLMIDAVFHRDFHGNDSTIFASGSNKNGMSPVNWSCPVSQSIPDKNDLLDVFTHVRRAGPNPTDSLWLFGGVSIENTTGNRYFDFELYQTDFYYNRTTRTFNNYGPNAGHTAWSFDASGNILTPGDIIFSAEYGSSSLTMIEARIWVKRSALSITPTQFRWGTEFDGDGSTAAYGYASIAPLTSGDFYTGLQSGNNVWAGPFSLILGDNSMTTNYVARQFMEFSVNMSKLGLDPASYSSNVCGSPFRRVMVKTRSSTSFSAELKDFVAPFRLFDYPVVDAYSDLIYFCGSMPTVPLTAYNANSSSVYTWSTPNGNIVGSNVGTTININSAGTYYVNHQLHSSCPVYSKDSIKIIYDPVCLVLDMQINSIEAIKNVHGISIQWQIKNNQYAKTIQIEYSTDGTLFNAVGSMDGNGHAGDETYSYLHSGFNEFPRMLFYRIRITDENGREKISSVVSINNLVENIQVFPVPSKGNIWMEIPAGTTQYSIIDASGKIFFSEKIFLKNAKNIAVTQTANLASGIYFIKFIHENFTTTKKIIIEK